MKIERAVPETLAIEERRSDFGEVVRNLTCSEAIFEAARCLYCYDAPCVKGCPTQVNIPEFIARIRTRNFLGAAKLIYLANPFGSICGRVCPTEVLCEKNCTSKLLNVPITIGHLQRFICDYALSTDKVSFIYPETVKGKVAVIGGGPAGLSCAHFLRRRGYAITLFEKEDALGGLLRSGIPAYRLPSSIVEQEISLIARGLRWEKCTVLNEEARRILSEYDAIFLAPGLGAHAKLNVPGEDLPSVLSANQFLRDLAQGNAHSYKFSAKEVAVVGAGSTAMDAARSSLRLGAERVTIIYRRTQEEMPAFYSEYAAALEEGVQFLWLLAPVSIQPRGSKLLLELERMRLGEPDLGHRRSPVPTGSRFTLLVDHVLEAVASKPDQKSLAGWSGLELTPSGQPRTTQLQSTNPKIFLGGDVLGGGTVVQAIADGKASAEGIDHWLRKKDSQ